MLDNKTPNTPDIEEFLCFDDYDKVPGFIISQTAYAIRKSLAKRFKDAQIDLTPHELAILNRLAVHPALNQRELAELTYKDRPAVTRMLHRLISKGLVEKQINDDDRRAFLVALTDQGMELRNRVIPIAQEVMRQALRDIRLEDLESTIQALRKITANLNPKTG